MLTITNLKAGYNGMEILHGIDLEVKPKEIVALIGPNGAGKSTVLKSIFNLCEIYSGKIIFKNKNITKMPTYQLIYEGISYVPQGRQVFSSLTVKENLEMGAFIMGDGELIKRNIKEIFEKIKEINKEGVFIIIVEQNAKKAVEIADKTYILEDGKVALKGGKEILEDKRIKDIYFGGR